MEASPTVPAFARKGGCCSDCCQAGRKVHLGKGVRGGLWREVARSHLYLGSQGLHADAAGSDLATVPILVDAESRVQMSFPAELTRTFPQLKGLLAHKDKTRAARRRTSVYTNQPTNAVEPQGRDLNASWASPASTSPHRAGLSGSWATSSCESFGAAELCRPCSRKDVLLLLLHCCRSNAGWTQ